MNIEPYTRRVYYYETDMMSFVHNSNYLKIFEEARIDRMDKIGIAYSEMEDFGISIPQTEAHVYYKQALHYGDTFSVYAKFTKFNGVIMTLEYEVRKEPKTNSSRDGGDRASSVLIATGSTSHCFLNSATGRPVAIRKHMPEVYKLLMEALEEPESSSADS